MNLIARTSLYFSEGRSDKEYHAEIVEVAGGHFVNFRYCRRGGTLTVGTKTATPVDDIQAKAIFDKLLKEKLAKGYTPDSSGAAYQGSERAGRKTDFVPQLPRVC
jgi:bifunctional non-homologous end joining protein LigD